jgi:hypothetical protein
MKHNKLVIAVFSFVMILGVAFMGAKAYASGLTSSQVQAIVNLLQAFGADAGTIAKVQLTLEGSTTSGLNQTNPSVSVSVTSTSPLTQVPVTLKINIQGQSSNGAFANVSIAGYPQNKAISYWDLSIGCPNGVTVSGKNGENICGTTLRFDTIDLYDPTLDYLALTIPVINNSDVPATVTLSLTAYNSTGNVLGSDKEGIDVGVASAASPIVITSPQAGSVWSNDGKDVIMNIQWKDKGVSGQTVGITLLDPRGNIVKVITNNLPDMGSYAWKYDPSISNGNYKISIGIDGKGGTPAVSGPFMLQ